MVFSNLPHAPVFSALFLLLSGLSVYWDIRGRKLALVIKRSFFVPQEPSPRTTDVMITKTRHEKPFMVFHNI